LPVSFSVQIIYRIVSYRRPSGQSRAVYGPRAPSVSPIVVVLSSALPGQHHLSVQSRSASHELERTVILLKYKKSELMLTGRATASV